MLQNMDSLKPQTSARAIPTDVEDERAILCFNKCGLRRESVKWESVCENPVMTFPVEKRINTELTIKS